MNGRKQHKNSKRYNSYFKYFVVVIVIIIIIIVVVIIIIIIIIISMSVRGASSVLHCCGKRWILRLALSFEGRRFHVQAAENLEDFASNLFLRMGMLRRFEESDLRLLACERGESYGQVAWCSCHQSLVCQRG